MDDTMQSVHVPPNFDPWTQPLNFTMSDGNGGWILIQKSWEDLDTWRIYDFRVGISYGVGFGASLMLLLTLLLLTKAEKRKSCIFLLNAACLLTNGIRCLLFCTWITGNFNNPYSVMSQSWEHITGYDFASYITINIFGILVTALIFTSLSLQVWIVCVTTPPLHRNIIMAVTTAMAGVAFGFRVAAVYYNTKLTLAFEGNDSVQNLTSTSYVIQVVAIWLFSCVFTFKLGHAILQRRRLNMPQFGPMQIVFIMGLQTMLVPAIFASLQFTNVLPEIVAHVLTVVCIFLPLSAMWAGVVNDQNLASRAPNSHQQLLNAEFCDASRLTTLSSGSTAYDKDKTRQMSV
ncbi:hypothetical protein CFE70_004850 [Pyrenophora teres f. teres 0-1]|uniref:Pheromone receptor PREB n=1 Tax=Pyrenophora teres f. teres (strain 0-1) TaxID=861557 RepID=E3RI43_PYRTT|nr:hypothetical protein PTT_07645 [Pyrenophora teres f. teres 0-1]